MQYKAIGFDYLGVIYGMTGVDYTRNMARFLSVSPEELDKTYFEYSHKVSSGKGTMEDVWRDVARALEKNEEELITFTKKVEMDKDVNQNILALMRFLRERGYKIGVLSNYGPNLSAILDKQGVTPYVDIVASSGKTGYKKPHPQAFLDFCASLGIMPQELVYIDDTPRYLKTADEVGFTPILFEDYDQLVKRLKELKVLS